MLHNLQYSFSFLIEFFSHYVSPPPFTYVGVGVIVGVGLEVGVHNTFIIQRSFVYYLSYKYSLKLKSTNKIFANFIKGFLLQESKSHHQKQTSVRYVTGCHEKKNLHQENKTSIGVLCRPWRRMMKMTRKKTHHSSLKTLETWKLMSK